MFLHISDGNSSELTGLNRDLPGRFQAVVTGATRGVNTDERSSAISEESNARQRTDDPAWCRAPGSKVRRRLVPSWKLDTTNCPSVNSDYSESEAGTRGAIQGP